MTDQQRKRRRSAHVSTLLVGGAAALMLSGCGGEEVQETEARIFPTVEACQVEFGPQECSSAFEQAKQLHLQTTPRFDSAAACEATMGNGACQPLVLAQPDGSMSSVFVPALMGFMLAKALQPPSQSYGGGYIGGRGGYYYPRPIFIDRDGFMHSGRGTLGRAPVSRDSFSAGKTGYSMKTEMRGKSGQVGTVTKSTNRGGFGKSSAKFGGGGS
ncbi:hypothetical protein CHU95_04005 [Niveispirillum lacus]|uniref:DUF1190 domain-containing protein n=1 Tax=Niveispirillum lacus TaxID=1981099 RepID=A0A255Z4M7_9PROT|nr:DUF1190 domain-containing protein [Niveispirillum lacus]OYQ36406.1 hypothetical protein CHU95_04005 [Niveispirillum lacus]